MQARSSDVKVAPNVVILRSEATKDLLLHSLHLTPGHKSHKSKRDTNFTNLANSANRSRTGRASVRYEPTYKALKVKWA
jgi:hypothetical protein